MLVLVWGRIGRMANRFDNLFAHWRAGTLPKPRPSRAGAPIMLRETARFPTGRAWLVHVVGYEAAGRASQLQHLLANPDMAEFLQAAPQAGRILRPLCHMLGIDPPIEATRALPPPLKPPTPARSGPARRPLRHASSAPPLRFSPA